MKYKVKTDMIQRCKPGDILVPGNVDAVYWNDRTSIEVEDYIVERNPEWFEPITQEYKVGDWVVIEKCSKKDSWYKDSIGELRRILSKLIPDWYGGEMMYKTSESGHGVRHCDIRKATPEEIEQALIKEAKRRGFKEGVKVRFGNWSIHELEGSCVSYDINIDCMVWGRFGNGPLIYRKGKWAEIIEDEPIQINGYKVTFTASKKDPVKVGCRCVREKVFIDLENYIREFDLAIYRKGEDITEPITKIAERL